MGIGIMTFKLDLWMQLMTVSHYSLIINIATSVVIVSFIKIIWWNMFYNIMTNFFGRIRKEGIPAFQV